jgi:D-arabinose 1-dehydrogenase-like Zn-dependent alcohol dehydrogenase
VKALQYRSAGSAPEVVTVLDPEPGPGQILLKVTAAGVCHSDLARAGSVEVHIETYALDEAPRAYERLSQGAVTGRAVILPNG